MMSSFFHEEFDVAEMVKYLRVIVNSSAYYTFA